MRWAEVALVMLTSSNPLRRDSEEESQKWTNQYASPHSLSKQKLRKREATETTQICYYNRLHLPGKKKDFA